MHCVACGAEVAATARFCAECGATLATTAGTPDSRAAVDGVPHSAGSVPHFVGFWRRAAAFGIDIIALALLIALALALLMVGARALGTAATEGSDPGPADIALAVAIPLLLPLLYFAAFESSSWQATPGKRLLGMRVVERDGGPLSFLRASGRTLAKLFPGLLLFPFSFLLAGFSRRKCSLHDLVARTLVIRTGAPAGRLDFERVDPRGARWWGGLFVALALSALWLIGLGSEVANSYEGRELQRALGLMPPDEPLLTGKSARPAR